MSDEPILPSAGEPQPAKRPTGPPVTLEELRESWLQRGYFQRRTRSLAAGDTFLKCASELGWVLAQDPPVYQTVIPETELPTTPPAPETGPGAPARPPIGTGGSKGPPLSRSYPTPLPVSPRRRPPR